MSSRKIEDLTPRMQVKINHFNKRLLEEGLSQFKISCTERLQIEQDALYSRGRNSLAYVNQMYAKAGLEPITAEMNKNKITWTKESVHTKKEAVDYYILKDGKYCNDLKVDIDKDNIPDWQEFGKIALECGLDWGGYWTPKKADYPHVQWKD